jgi:hypothetical protein
MQRTSYERIRPPIELRPGERALGADEVSFIRLLRSSDSMMYVAAVGHEEYFTATLTVTSERLLFGPLAGGFFKSVLRQVQQMSFINLTFGGSRPPPLYGTRTYELRQMDSLKQDAQSGWVEFTIGTDAYTYGLVSNRLRDKVPLAALTRHFERVREAWKQARIVAGLPA